MVHQHQSVATLVPYIFPISAKTFFGLHENHPGHSLAQPENFSWVGHGFQRIKIIFLQGSNLQMRLWPHCSILKAEAPLGRLWSGLQTVAHSAAVPRSPAAQPPSLLPWLTSLCCGIQSRNNHYKIGAEVVFTPHFPLLWFYLGCLFNSYIFWFHLRNHIGGWGQGGGSLMFMFNEYIWVFNASRAEQWKDFCSALQKRSQSLETYTAGL